MLSRACILDWATAHKGKERHRQQKTGRPTNKKPDYLFLSLVSDVYVIIRILTITPVGCAHTVIRVLGIQRKKEREEEVRRVSLGKNSTDHKKVQTTEEGKGTAFYLLPFYKIMLSQQCLLFSVQTESCHGRLPPLNKIGVFVSLAESFLLLLRLWNTFSDPISEFRFPRLSVI